MKAFYESLKLFYLGNSTDEQKTPILYKNKDLNTHALIIGMTGSGKTGLGINILEEAAIDNIPSLIIDPKGDMGNLLLNFPNLSKEEFEPWVNATDNKNKEIVAEETAKLWRDGIKNSGQDINRIQRLKNSADFSIYTPGSTSGISVCMLDSFEAPPKEIINDLEALNSYISSTVSSLLDLIDIKSDSLSGKEHILISNILKKEFENFKDLSIESLISYIISPPFKKIGVFELETFYAKKDRIGLAKSLNSLIANPSFQAWRIGESLNIDKMLFTKEGKARASIFNIAHLNDSQRMFFVSILLNKLISWMRRQEGSSTLRAILYMDEIFGFFPPTKNPPSKQPMLTLLKQARAYGLSMVLSTQNPVDLDYKGLSNIGTWFIGRLQTAGDKNRVIDGLTGIQGSRLSKNEIYELLSSLEKRTFLLKNIHEEGLTVFQTRWALSYLKGPLNKEQISNLMKNKKTNVKELLKNTSEKSSIIPVISSKISQIYSYRTAISPYELEPYIAIKANVRFYDKKRNIDEVKNISLKIALSDNMQSLDWQQAERFDEPISKKSDKNLYANLPKFITQANSLSEFEKDFADYLYRFESLELFRIEDLGLESQSNETIESFKMRAQTKCNEKMQEEIDKIEEKFKKEREKIEDKLKKAEIKLEKEKSDVSSKILDSAISIGTSVISAFFGRKLLSSTNISKAASGARSAKRVLSEKQDVKYAQEQIVYIEDNIKELENSLQEQIKELEKKYDLANFPIISVEIKPRRVDIYGIESFLLWREV